MLQLHTILCAATRAFPSLNPRILAKFSLHRELEHLWFAAKIKNSVGPCCFVSLETDGAGLVAKKKEEEEKKKNCLLVPASDCLACLSLAI